MAQVKLFGAIAREDEVRVGVYKAGQDGTATRIEAASGWYSVKVYSIGQRVLRSHPDDAPITRGQRALCDHPQRIFWIARREGDEAAGSR